MANLFIEGSSVTPTIKISEKGCISLKGKAIPERADLTLGPVFEWIEACVLNSIEFDIDLYYFNTAISKQMYEMFKKAINNSLVKKVTVKWRYEEGDEDVLESGMTYKEDFPMLDFKFYAYAEM